MKSNKDVKVGDIIHIHRVEGEPHYTGSEGVVEFIDSAGTIYGSWGKIPITLYDKWEIVD